METVSGLNARVIKRLGREHGVKLSSNAFALLEEMSNALVQAYRSTSDSLDEARQSWCHTLALMPQDRELLPKLVKAHRILELHRACASNEHFEKGLICCPEIQDMIPCVRYEEKAKSDWIVKMDALVMANAVIEWIVMALGKASRELERA